MQDWELAKEVIGLKIAKELKSHKYKSFKELEEKVSSLKEEEKQVNLQNQEVVKKVLSEYLEEVKIEND